MAVTVAVAVAVAGSNAIVLAQEHREQSMRREMNGDLLSLHRHLGMEGERDLALRGVALPMPATRQLLCSLEHLPLLRGVCRQRPSRSRRPQQFRPIGEEAGCAPNNDPLRWPTSSNAQRTRMSRAKPLPRSGDRSKAVMVGIMGKLRVIGPSRPLSRSRLRCPVIG